MASTATKRTPEKAILGTLLQPGLPVDTDGLPGLTDAPVVYDLILRELREEDVATEGSAVSTATPPERRRAVSTRPPRGR